VTGNGASELPRESSAQHSIPASPLVSHETPTDSFEKFGQVATAIASTCSKLEKVRLLAEYLRSVQAASLPTVVTWFTGTPFAATGKQGDATRLGPRCAKLFAPWAAFTQPIPPRLPQT